MGNCDTRSGKGTLEFAGSQRVKGKRDHAVIALLVDQGPRRVISISRPTVYRTLLRNRRLILCCKICVLDCPMHTWLKALPLLFFPLASQTYPQQATDLTRVAQINLKEHPDSFRLFSSSDEDHGRRAPLFSVAVAPDGDVLALVARQSGPWHVVRVKNWLRPKPRWNASTYRGTARLCSQAASVSSRK